MYRVFLEERMLKVLRNVKRYPAKVHRQITLKILLLQANPRPPDCKKVGIGYRVDIGEHRILYTVDDEERIVRVELVGPRNDDEVYRLARRLGLI